MNGDKYEGEFEKDFEHGKGIKIFKNHDYLLEVHGEFKRGVPHGNVEVKLQNGDKFKGKMKNGKIEGKGKMTYTEDERRLIYYEGNWKKGRYEGLGVLKM